MSQRIPWVAALMSLVLPGFGQLYNGQLNRGIWFFLIFSALLIPGTTLAALYLPSQIILPLFVACLFVCISAWVYSVVDAYVQAGKQENQLNHPWQTAGFYTLVLVLFSTVLLPIMIDYVRQRQVRTFYIPSSSMSPTIQQGDFLFADMRYNCPTCKVSVSRGDIVVFVYPNNRTQYFIKRIIGLPGDRIEMSADGLFVNQKPVNTETSGDNVIETFDGKSWLVTSRNAKDSVDMEVPNGQVYVLGDNRDLSNDSRVFGTVPLADVVGRARQIWFSKSDEGIEWGRIGQIIE